MAIEFVDVDDDKRSRIEEFVERLRKEFPATSRLYPEVTATSGRRPPSP